MKVYLSREALKQYDNLPKFESSKIRKKLSALEKGLAVGKNISGCLTGLKSLKAWPYRIIYQVDNNCIYIVSILHRQGAYKHKSNF